MSIIAIGDVHAKRKNMDVIKKTFNFLFGTDYYKKSSTLIFQGDIFDVRRNIDVLVLNEMMEIFEKMKNKNIKIIVGNHDMYNKNSNEITSLNILEKAFENVEIIKKETLKDIDGISFYLLPFGSQIDKEKIKKADYILGHLEIAPFFPDSSIHIRDFEGKRVFMGHQHKFDPDNTPYMGSMFSTSYSERDNKKHFLFIKDKENYKFFANEEDTLYLTLKIENDKLCIPFLNREFPLNELTQDMFENRYNYYLEDKEENIDKMFFILSNKNIFLNLKVNVIEETEEAEEIEIDENVINSLKSKDIFEIFKNEIFKDSLKKEIFYELEGA